MSLLWHVALSEINRKVAVPNLLSKKWLLSESSEDILKRSLLLNVKLNI